MASSQPTTPQEPRNPASTSHGRGGAGNISSKPTVPVEANDLSTPTIKSATYTTGRGGTGNMALNDPANPGVARAAQDVEAPAHHKNPAQGTYHWGRGGEGNMMKLGGKNGDKVDGKNDARSRSRDVSGKKDEKKTTTTSTTLGNGGEEHQEQRQDLSGGEEKAPTPRRPSLNEKGQRRGSFKEVVKEKLGLGHHHQHHHHHQHEVKDGRGRTEAESAAVESAIDE